MSKQVINDQESVGSIRTKLNGNFTEVYDGLADKVDKVTGYTLSKNDLSDVLKSNYDSAVEHVSTSHPDMDNFFVTPEGGFARKFVNKTGAASVKGTLVSLDAVVDEAVKATATSGDDAIGVMYSNGVADGTEVWVVWGGVAEILVEDAEAAALNYYVIPSASAAGRVKGSATLAVAHVGHFIKAESAGTDVLAKVMLHFD